MKALSLVLGAFFLLAAGVMIQSFGWAQGGATGIPGGPPQAQNSKGMHIYIWAGPKTHGEGQHDYPLFLGEWSKLLMEKGAVVDGSLHPPTSADLEHTDVVIIFVGDAGYMNDTQKAMLEQYVKRGGGLVALHDSMCGPDPAFMASMLGGAKKHGEINFTWEAPIHYEVADKTDPIMKDMSDFTIWDEAFFLMTWAKNPGIHVLANITIPATQSAGTHKGEIAPQMWEYEHTLPGGQPARAFVWMQGHTHTNFANWQVQRTLLRGIAWAAKRPVDELVDYVAPARGMPPGGGMAPVPSKKMP
jgi:type 1 glutamine amidotransferase